MLKLTEKGRAHKKDIIKFGYPIIDYGLTATEIKEEYGILIPMDKRVQLCLGFKYKRIWRGYVPVFDVQAIIIAKQNGEL